MVSYQSRQNFQDKMENEESHNLTEMIVTDTDAPSAGSVPQGLRRSITEVVQPGLRNTPGTRENKHSQQRKQRD